MTQINRVLMKTLLRSLFSPILNQFESGEQTFSYKPSHRLILKTVGILFSCIISFILYLSVGGETLGYLIPVTVFGAVSLVCLVVGFLGTDRAVAKIWGNVQ